MVEVKQDSDHPARFSPASYLESIVVLAFPVTILDVMRVFIDEYIDLLNIEVANWQAGPYGEELVEHFGRPSPADFAALQIKTVTNAHLLGRFRDDFAFGSCQILSHRGGAGMNSYGYTDCVSFRLTSGDLSADQTPERVRRVIDSHVSLVRALINRFPVLRAHIYRSANSYAPEPPHFYSHHILYIAHREDIAKSYDDPDLYWQSWDTVEPLDDNRVLLTKGLQIDDELAFKKEIYPRVWELARQARPQLTNYFIVELREHDKAYYNEGSPTLTQIGYHPEEHWVEYTAWAEGDVHIRPREIQLFQQLLWNEELNPGTPLKEIRVVFIDKEMADKEKRPLLDVGCRVFHYDAEGELQELTE